MTIGDVLTAVASLVGICVTAWTLIMGTALLFQSTATRARDSLRQSPWRSFFTGLILVLTLGLVSVILLKTPLPLPKLAGTMIYLSLMALAVGGSAGLALLLSERVRSLDPSATPYGSLTRAVGLIVVSGAFPLLGWLLVGPALIVTSVGAGFLAITHRAAVLIES